MQKAQVVAALGQQRLMLPIWVKTALTANDRLKLYLTVLQAASAHAEHPKRDIPDFSGDIAATKLNINWLHELVVSATRVDNELFSPDIVKLSQCLAEELSIMAKPILETSESTDEPHLRVQHWLDFLTALPADRLSDTQIELLTQGRRGKSDSLHLLIMDLHKKINHLSGELASEVIEGANVWDLLESDRGRVVAFMCGLNRTAFLKFDHPGLETVATRDGEHLLLQNDIGTNDAHVLVIQITGLEITLTYSDLHRQRLAFFQAMLTPLGAVWSDLTSQTSANLNAGEAYSVATAKFDCANEDSLDSALEGIASRIVFLIDWNHARKRLQGFVKKTEAIAILTEIANLEVGHRAWLQVGGEKIIFAAMQSAGEGAFRIGDRLDEVIGVEDAHAFLVAVMQLSCDALRTGQPAALVADETRMLLAQYVRHRTNEFDLLAEHSSYCHALAQAVSDSLAHGAETSNKAAQELAARAKAWERKADHLVIQARENADRQPRWQPIAILVEQSDNVADALEEAAFLISLIADHQKGWNNEVRKALAHLAATVLQSTQDYVKALAIARTLGSDSEAVDNEDFLAATWQVLQAERHCDALLREARRVILKKLKDAPSLMLANDLAIALETASDYLLTAAYTLRDVAFDKTGIRE